MRGRKSTVLREGDAFQLLSELRSSGRMAPPELSRCSAFLLLSFVLAGACGDRRVDSGSKPPGVVVTALSRSSAVEPAVRSVPSLGTVPNERARKQILSHVPPMVDGPDTPSTLGTDTGETQSDAGAASSASPKSSASPLESHVSMVARPSRSSTSIEKLLRATVYFQLVDRCRDEAHAILPPEAVVLGFEIDAGGAIIDGTIKAEPKDPRHEPAAECMIRELAASSFRAPPAAKGESTTVTMPVPSVD